MGIFSNIELKLKNSNIQLSTESAVIDDAAVVTELSSNGDVSIHDELETIVRDEYVAENHGEGTDVDTLSEEDLSEVNSHVEAMQPAIESAKVAASLLIAGKLNSFGKTGKAENVNNLTVSTESFQVQNASNYKEQTVRFNLNAAIQDEFSKLFAPLLVGTPDKADWVVDFSQIIFGRFAQHERGKAIEESQNMRSLQEAYMSTKVLKNESTKLVPYYTEEHKEFFAPGVAPVQNEEVGYETSHFATGKEINVISMSMGPNRPSSFTQNATIHRNVVLNSILIEVKLASGDKEVLEVKTSSMPHSKFNRLNQDETQQLILSMLNQKVRLGKLGAVTAQRGGAASTFIDALKSADLSLDLELSLNGSINLARGGAVVNGNVIASEKALNDSNESVALPAALVDAEFKVIGFNNLMRLTNSDLATMGVYVDSIERQQIYRVSLHAPFIAHKTLQGNGEPEPAHLAIKTNELIQTARAAMAAETLNKFVEYFEDVKMYADSLNDEEKNQLNNVYRSSPIQGIGSYLVAPQAIEVNMSMADVNSLSSKDKLTDARAYVAGVLADTISRLIQDSRINTAIPIYAPNAKPVAKVVTSPRIHNFMMIEGDPRTSGNFNMDLVEHMAKEMTDTFYIQIAVDAPSTNTFNPLGSGHTLWIPEVVGEVPIMRGNSTINELGVQPQFEVVYNMPVLAKVTIAGISEFLKNYTIIKNSK